MPVSAINWRLERCADNNLYTAGCPQSGVLPVGPLSQDAVTPEQIALYVPITGALAADATASVEYRLVGAGSYNNAVDMWRIDPTLLDGSQPAGVVNAFASTIFDLTPGLDYEVRVTVTSPGVGTEVLTATYSTRALPGVTGATTVTVTNLTELQNAISTASAGDVIQFSGTISPTARIDISASGTEANPIVLRGDNRDTAIIDSSTSVFRFMPGVEHWIIEDCTLRGPGLDSGTSASRQVILFDNSGASQNNCTFRRLRMDGCEQGVISFNAVNGMLIYDCIIEGTNAWTQANLESNLTWNDDGIRLGGVGNCVWNCDLADFGDAVSFRQQLISFSVIGSYYYRNKILRSGDDAVEAEYCQRNCAFYDNYVANCQTFVSIDGVYGGPYYHHRNRHINCGRTIIKNGAVTSGALFYNNSFVKTTGQSNNDGGFRGWYWSVVAQVNDWEFRNNMFLWEGSNSILRFDEAQSGWTPLVMTNNGWGRNGQTIHYAGVALPYTSVGAANAALTPIHDNDIELTNQAAVFETPVVFGANYLTEITTEYSLALRTSPEGENAGIVIPNISQAVA